MKYKMLASLMAVSPSSLISHDIRYSLRCSSNRKSLDTSTLAPSSIIRPIPRAVSDYWSSFCGGNERP
jgi:hypothetical protein